MTIWAYCANCWGRTEQAFVREDARFEYYKCYTCGGTHPVAVR